MIFSKTLIVSVACSMAILLFSFRYLALKLGLVDQPNSRKIHSRPIPLVGGLALYALACGLLFVIQPDEFVWYLMGSVTLVVTVGLLDDIFSLSALWRFAVQIMASIIIIYFTGVKLHSFGQLLYPNWEMELGLMSIPITIFGVVGVINALNMADGIDGLAAMTFFCPIVAIISISGESTLTLWLMLLLVCVVVFVLFNKSQSQKVFLGDNGSLLLGFLLAWSLVFFSQNSIEHVALIKPVTALYLVGLPIFDTIFVMLRRILKGVSPFKPDKTHLHHLLLSCGLSQTLSLLVMVFMQVVFIVIGVVLLKITFPEYLQFYLFVGLSVVYYVLMSQVWKKHNDV